MLSRRTFLKILAAAQTFLSPSAFAAPRSKLDLGPAQKFDFEVLKALAEEKARAPYLSPPMPDARILKRINYDAARAIHYDLDSALYGNGSGPYPVTFLTCSVAFLKSIKMYALDGDAAREVIFHPDYFIRPGNSPLNDLPSEPSPFAGFELRQAYNKPGLRDHEGWARFIGASYFRAVGEANQFGLSARGLAQNSGGPGDEEFPDFTHFWIAEGKTDADPVTVYALLDGPSVTGAYRFIMHRGRATKMEITCELHLRKPITRIGIAPLTSMFWFSETVKGAAVDWRPEVHDSDGLAMWTGAGEHLWRPLNDPPRLDITTFLDENPRGFGLMQRDKNYDHYLDVVYYERRPCGWIEPLHPWGKGTVQLVEIPTDNEIYDNIIAMWVPAEPTYAGQRLAYRYNLYWQDNDPFPGDLAICVATRLGKGGGKGAVRSNVLRNFVIEFQGPSLAKLDEGEIPEAVLSATAGHFENITVEPSPDGRTDLYRARFDLDPEGHDVVDLRCFLRFAGKPLTETWLFHYLRFDSPVR
jgi:glucans biosynthesis protein